MRNKCLLGLGLVFVISLTSMVAFAFSFTGTPADEVDETEIIVSAKAEYNDYQSAVARWEQQTGNKAESDSFRARLQQKQMEVKERENNRQSHYYRNDRGGR